MEEYKARMAAEYSQLTDRLVKLQNLLRKWDAGALNFTPTCPRDLLQRQCEAMSAYRDILTERAAIENVPLGPAESEG